MDQQLRTIIFFLAGIAAALILVAIFKWRVRKMPMSVAEKAEYLSRRRARMLPFLAVIFLTQQASYFTQSSATAVRAVDTVKISAWLVLSVIIVAALATKGFWLETKEVRELVDDENTRANRLEGMRWGFLFAMGAGVVIYFLTMFEPVSAREAVHITMSAGIVAALVRWGVLERRAHA
ncbi:MAG TPA: hypothetical protein VF027_00310 [Sphingomicrobium sp.]